MKLCYCHVLLVFAALEQPPLEGIFVLLVEILWKRS